MIIHQYIPVRYHLDIAKAREIALANGMTIGAYIAEAIKEKNKNYDIANASNPQTLINTEPKAEEKKD